MKDILRYQKKVFQLDNLETFYLIQVQDKLKQVCKHTQLASNWLHMGCLLLVILFYFTLFCFYFIYLFFSCGLMSCDSFLFPQRRGRKRNCELQTDGSLEYFVCKVQLSIYLSNKSHYLLPDYSFIIFCHYLYLFVNSDFKNSSVDFDITNSRFPSASNSEILLLFSM